MRTIGTSVCAGKRSNRAERHPRPARVPAAHSRRGERRPCGPRGQQRLRRLAAGGADRRRRGAALLHREQRLPVDLRPRADRGPARPPDDAAGRQRHRRRLDWDEFSDFTWRGAVMTNIPLIEDQTSTATALVTAARRWNRLADRSDRGSSWRVTARVDLPDSDGPGQLDLSELYDRRRTGLKGRRSSDFARSARSRSGSGVSPVRPGLRFLEEGLGLRLRAALSAEKP